MTLKFNGARGGAEIGGHADEIDWRNVNLGASATIDVNRLLGRIGQPQASSANFVAMSATIAGHEMGHLLGLQHRDAFGPIGTGIYAAIDSRRYLPAYPGPSGAVETARHLSASPDSVRSTLFDAIGDPYLGERERIKLAFADTGVTVAEATGDHSLIATAQPLVPVPLYVPGATVAGVGRAMDVAALNVVGTIGLAPDARSQSDFYTFDARAGDLFNFEVVSRVLPRSAGRIDSILRLYDAEGVLVPYYGGLAENDDSLQNTDSVLVDVRIPADGAYYLEVDTFTFGFEKDGDADTGDYELFLYVVAERDAQGAGDVVLSGAGHDLLIASSGDDAIEADLEFDTVLGGSGRDVTTSGKILGVEIGDDRAMAEGEEVVLVGRFIANSLAGVHSYQWRAFNAEGGVVAAGSEPTFRFAAPDQGTYRIVFTVRDDRGAVGSDSLTIVAENRAPSATLVASEVSETTGDVSLALIDPSDPGTADVEAGFTYAFDFGSGFGPFTHVGRATGRASGPAVNDRRTVRAWVRDKDGAQTGLTALVKVTNVAPTAEITGTPTAAVAEGTAITLGSTVTDPSPADTAAGFTYAWSVTKDGVAYASGSAAGFTFSPDVNGIYVVTLRATDNRGLTSDPATATVTATNVAPMATFVSSADVSEGGSIRLGMTDPREPGTVDSVRGFTYAFDFGDGQGFGEFGTVSEATRQAADNGTRTVRARVRDKDGAETESTAIVTVTNVAPTAEITGKPTDAVAEGTAITLGSKVTDPGSADIPGLVTYAWSVTRGGADYATGRAASFVFTPDDNGTYLVTLRASDKDGLAGEPATATIEVTNVAPTAGSIAAPSGAVAVRVPVSVSAPMTDPGARDTHTATWTWGDNTTSAGSITKVNGSWKVAGSHEYANPGLYTVTLRVTDDDKTWHESIYRYVVVYSPTAGSVTGKGQIDSPAGTAVAYPEYSGVADFTFNAKYRSGRTTPEGETKFRIEKVDFLSTSYEWLVIEGPRTRARGVGQIEGNGGYGFLVAALDGQAAGGGGTDRFRIKIWRLDTGDIVYDNQPLAPDDATPTLATRGGGGIKVSNTVSSLLAASAPPAAPVGSVLSQADLAPIVAEAVARWEALGADFEPFEVMVGDLKGSTLGLATPGTIWIDQDAAGFGWFIDATPGDDSEFSVGIWPVGIDLFSVVAHELGHLLGLEHSHEDDHADALMAESLAPGTRRSPTARDLAAEATVEVVVTVPRPDLPADLHPTALDHWSPRRR